MKIKKPIQWRVATNWLNWIVGWDKELTDEEKEEQILPEINEEARLKEYNETGNL